MLKTTASLASALAICTLLGACTPGGLRPGRGLYTGYDLERLETEGYPDHQHAGFFWPGGVEGEWGLLYDDDGKSYGPNAYYHHDVPQDHPDFKLEEKLMEGRWFTMAINEDAVVSVFAHFMELLDLAYYDMREQLQYEPAGKIGVYCTVDLDHYTAVSGHEYWVTHAVDGDHIVFEPVGILFRRTLAAHAARNAVALSFIDMKCHGLAPPWFAQGLAAYMAEEGNELLNFVNEFRPKTEVVWGADDVVAHVHPLIDRQNGRIALYNSFLMVWHMAETWGFGRVQNLLDAMEEGSSFDHAVKRAYGMSEGELMARIDPYVIGESITIPRFE